MTGGSKNPPIRGALRWNLYSGCSKSGRHGGRMPQGRSGSQYWLLALPECSWAAPRRAHFQHLSPSRRHSSQHDALLAQPPPPSRLSVSTPSVPLPSTQRLGAPAPAPTVTVPSVNTPSVKLLGESALDADAVRFGRWRRILAVWLRIRLELAEQPCNAARAVRHGIAAHLRLQAGRQLLPSGGPSNLGGGGHPAPPRARAVPLRTRWHRRRVRRLWWLRACGWLRGQWSWQRFGGGFAPAASRANLATTAGIRSALAPLAGCFYGLSQPELTVINLRAGFNGQAPHTRQQAARRLGTSPGQIRLVERQALQRLNGLALTRGCGATTELVGAVTVVNGFIGPAEIAISPALIAFGNPGYQGMGQSSFASLGQVPPLRSPGPLPAAFGSGASNGSTWGLPATRDHVARGTGRFPPHAPALVARLAGNRCLTAISSNTSSASRARSCRSPSRPSSGAREREDRGLSSVQ